MSMTYYTVDDLRPGRSGWGVKRFSTLNDAISHYRTLPMDGARVLGMADDTHAYELIRCVRLFPGDAQGEDVLAADYRRAGLTKKNAVLKDALDVCLAVFVEGTGWLSPQDVKKQRQLPLVLRYRVDGMTKDGAYLSLEVEPWEYDLLLEQTRDHYKMKKH